MDIRKFMKQAQVIYLNMKGFTCLLIVEAECFRSCRSILSQNNWMLLSYLITTRIRIADIGVLQHAILIQRYISGEKKTLPIYGHTKEKIDFERLTYKDVTVGIAYNPSEQLEVGPFKISFLETNHPVPCYAMRIEVADKHWFIQLTVLLKNRLARQSCFAIGCTCRVRHLAGTINLRLGAVRRLAYEAADCGLLSSDLAAGIRRVKA